MQGSVTTRSGCLLLLWLLLVVSLAGCSARHVVVKPKEVSKLNDPQWTIASDPASRPR
jgi:hypothetical protein